MYMNKVIKGRRYDTEKATLVAYQNRTYSDQEFIELFRKRTGEYFLAHWAPENSDNVGWIEPISYKEAMDFAEQHLDGEEFEKEFGTISDEAKTIISLSLPDDLVLKLNNLARNYCKTKSEIVASLIKKAK